MLHIDLTEQRRHHADEDRLKGSDGQMGKHIEIRRMESAWKE